MKGVMKIENDSYINLGVHAKFWNISCVHARKVACSVHAPMSLYSYLPLFRGPVGGQNEKLAASEGPIRYILFNIIEGTFKGDLQ